VDFDVDARRKRINIDKRKEGRIMANIYTSADQLIGKTPLLELTHIENIK